MTCPVCSVELVMSERQNVEIDYCPKCRGVWLDRGELDKIIEKAASAQSAPPEMPRGHRGCYEDEHYKQKLGKYKHKKSFLQELFD